MPSKLDTLKHQFTAHADRSLGMGGPTPVAGADSQGAIPIPEHLVGLVKSKDAAEIAIERLIPDQNQPREHFEADALAHLGESIATRGIIQPLRVRWDVEEGRYVIVAGERRWRAAQLVGLKTLPCIIHQGSPSAEEIMILQIQENLLREDLKPLEQAAGFQKLMAVQGWSANRLSKELAIPVSTVTRALELLDLPPVVQDLVDQGELAPSTACEIGRLEDPDAKIELAQSAAAAKLTKANVIEAVRERKTAAPGKSPTSKPASSKSSVPSKQSQVTHDIDIGLGRKVQIIGAPVDAGPAALLEILYQAVDKLKAEIAATN